ncbi:glycosyltransferase family 2 protein [Shouchella clausii]|uniref:glycosyltransferase family 2 protein n=1 Tax=Shouchella clausii TaxID=79880 RepID=UPI0015CCEC5B|nr:glycosyltransferase family 2 protein [Shouchella clausii]
MKFSIAIPVYNDANSIEKCLESIISQTIGHDSLEILCVNDGSTDNSKEILDLYASKYSFVKVFHERNSGSPSRPRNIAIANATGDYIYFVDGDDYLGVEALERMQEKIEKYGSEIVIGRYEGINRSVPRAVFEKNDECFDFIGSNAFYTASAQKLFKLDLLKKYNIRFPEHFSLGEDQPFLAKAYAYTNSIALVKDYPCYYLTNDLVIGRVQLTKQLLSGVVFTNRIVETLTVISNLNVDERRKQCTYFQYWHRILNVELKTLLHREMMIEDKDKAYSILSSLAKKHININCYRMFSSKEKVLIRILQTGNFEDLLLFWNDYHLGNGFIVNKETIVPKSFLAREIVEKERISFKKLNTFYAAVSSIKVKDNNLFIKGICYHSHLIANSQVLYFKIKERESGQEWFMPIKDIDIGFIKMNSNILKKASHQLFDVTISFNDVDINEGILDLYLVSQVEGITFNSRLEYNASVLLNKIILWNKEYSPYKTIHGNLSFIVKPLQENSNQNKYLKALEKLKLKRK